MARSRRADVVTAAAGAPMTIAENGTEAGLTKIIKSALVRTLKASQPAKTPSKLKGLGQSE